MYITIKNYFSKEPSLRVVVCMIISMDIFLLSILKNVRKAINISIWYNNLEEFNFGEIRMKTWMKLVFLSLIAVVLVACEGLHIKSKGIKMTEELKTDSVWIDVHHGEKVTLNPYDAVTAVYHFDGKGNVVAYLGLDIDLGEFSGKNDKQILEIAKKAHERNFYRQKQQLRERMEVQLESMKKEGIQLSWDAKNSTDVREKLKRLDETIKDVQKQFDAVVASNYKEPKARVVNYTFGTYDRDEYSKNQMQMVLTFAVQQLAKDSMSYQVEKTQKILREGFFSKSAEEVKDSYYVGLTEADSENDVPGDYHDFMISVRKGHSGIDLK